MRRCSLKKRKIAAKTRWQRELNKYPIFKLVDLSEFHTVARNIWGTITYEDAFGEKRYTNFAHSIVWILGKDGEMIFGFYADRHNDAT